MGFFLERVALDEAVGIVTAWIVSDSSDNYFWSPSGAILELQAM
jgi:hypothetical protein